MARVALHPLLCLALACHSRPCHVMACSPQLPQSLAIRNSQYFPQPQLPLKDDNLKFCSVITHAGANICKSISAFLKSVPDAEPEKYSKLKEHLISKYSQTVHQKINQLLAGVSLEGKNPSDLFNDMSSLAQGHVPVETVLLLWYRHLPTELVMVLGEAVTSSNAPQASAKVDRLFEHIKHKFTPQICAVAPPNSSQGVDDALVNRISELVISAVSSKFESNSMRDRSVEKQEKPQSPRSSSKPRHGENKDLCLYHHRLIDNVTKLSAKGQLAPANLTGVSVLDPLHPLAHLLSRYPQAIRPTTPNSDHVTAISHSLQTSGEPIAQKARRLTPEKLKALRFIAITKTSKPHSCPLSFRYEDLPDAERQDRPHIIELESKDSPGVECQDRARVIGSRAKTLLASSDKIVLASSSSRARTFLASSAETVLASSARKHRLSWRRATRSSSHHRAHIIVFF
ncbi:hypothetical protein TKK_0011105 [Trichogramma kaykai]